MMMTLVINKLILMILSQTSEKMRQYQEKFELAEQKLQQSLRKVEALPNVEAELQKRQEALSEAEERHGSAEERLAQLQNSIDEHATELQRVGIKLHHFLYYSPFGFCFDYSPMSLT